jgi:hypothetical protein
MGQQAGTYARSFRCEGNYSRSPERVVVLTQSASPTCDLYLRHRLAGSRLPVAYWTLGAPCPAPLDGSFLIIVRYVNRRAMKEIEEAASGLAGVAWLPGVTGTCRLNTASSWRISGCAMRAASRV